MNSDMIGLGNLLDELKNTDPNGLLTSSSLYRGLLREIARSSRYGNPLSIVRFRVVKDGSADQTAIHQAVSNKLGANVRIIDYVGTWSESEFLIFLPETTLEQAQQFVDKITPVLEDHPPAQIKVGTAQWEPQDDASSLLAKTEV